MVTIVTADACDVTHPLYGYKTRIMERLPERVPSWAFVEAARRSDEFGRDDTAEYLQAAVDEYVNASVAAGERLRLSTLALTCGVEGEKPGSIDVDFVADPDATHMTRGGSQYHMPDDMRERLKEMRRSSTFDRRFDGYNVRFRGWRFSVTVGRRGGIQDVDLYAWGKR